MQRSTLAKLVWLLLLAATVAVYFYGLGALPLVGPDEPRYAQVAREMFVRGDFVTPTLAGQTWFEKPALLYWMMMSSYAAFSVNEWAARLGPALAGLLTILFVGGLARRVETAAGSAMHGFGLAGAGVAASSAGFLVFSRGASFDIILTMTVTLALACFFAAEVARSETKRRWLLAGFYSGVGLSLLAKGLVGVVVPCGVVLLYLILRRQLPRPGRLGVWWGVPLALLVAATWYAPVIAAHGQSFISEFFIEHHFSRYVSNKYNHPQPFYFYIPITALLALPWTAFVVAGAGGAALLSGRGEEVASKLRLFALAWLVVPVVFFSLSGSKLPGYVLPALPGAALLAGEALARYTRREGGTLAMRGTGIITLLAAGGVAYAVNSQLITPACGLIAFVPLLLTATLALVWARSRRILCAVSVVCVTFLCVVVAVGCAVGKFAARESVRELLREASARGYESAPVLQLHVVERTAEFYAAGRLAYNGRGEPLKYEGVFQVADRARELGRPVLVIVPVKYVGQLTGDTRLETEVLADNGRVAIVAARAR